jgi:hypothetical protein
MPWLIVQMPSMDTNMPHPTKFLTLYRRLRSRLVHAAAAADDDTVRATLAYLALWLLASLSAVAYITHLSALFR